MPVFADGGTGTMILGETDDHHSYNSISSRVSTGTTSLRLRIGSSYFIVEYRSCSTACALVGNYRTRRGQLGRRSSSASVP